MTEIKISELSVGDWVRYRDREWQVCSLYKFTEEVGLWRKDSQFCEYVSDLHPIPLTPEILEKNGFTRWVRGSNKGDYYLDIPRTKRVWLYYDFGTYKMAYIRNTGGCETFFKCRDIASVHQLQHALRLAGVGKEIEV